MRIPSARSLESRSIFSAIPRQSLERKANGEKVFPHVFGTDMYGRDILVRVMYGARVSMSVGVFAAILVLVIGALYGAISGYCGGKVDAVMQRIVELDLCSSGDAGCPSDRNCTESQSLLTM